jgi:RNA polymerase sigma-70 factor (ECF subfamily)
METSPAAASPEVVAVLVENHRRFLAFLEGRVGSRDVAEDILQDALVRGLSRGGQIRDRESVVAWFYRALRNALADHWRKTGTERRIFDASVTAEDTDVAADPQLMETVCACALSLLDTLKPEYAEALRRVELDDVSVQEFAREQSVTPNNASVRLFRARAALKREVMRCCRSCAEHGCLDCSCSAS